LGGIKVFFDTDDLLDSEIYLKLIKKTDANIVKGYVPAYCFSICRCADDVEVGRCDLRIKHNPNTYYGGNIGYSVQEQYRGNHYAGKACLLLLKLAKKHEMEELIITCAPENIASQKTCVYFGAELKRILEVPAWHDLFKDGQVKTCQYIVKL
jgi:predicted acetyltransferase